MAFQSKWRCEYPGAMTHICAYIYIYIENQPIDEAKLSMGEWSEYRGVAGGGHTASPAG